MAIDKITKIDENFVLEGTHVVVPSGTTAQRPSGPQDGYVRFNTTVGSLEFYDGTAVAWVQTNLIPNIDTLTGNINDTYNATLSLATSNTTDIVTVVFRNSSNVELAEVTDIDSTTQPFYVDIPSSVTSVVSSGDSVKVIIQNADGTPSSPVTKTVIAAPTGGTINTYTEGGSAYRSHTFTSSGTWTIAEDLVVDQLIVAGGAGGAAGSISGASEGGGGGGAGGMLTDTGRTLVVGNSPYTVTVGAGGSGIDNSSANNVGGSGGNTDMSNNGVTAALGGGGGAKQEGDGASGGSGGGGGGRDSGDASTSGGSGTSGQGNAGGGTSAPTGDMGSGGGGKSSVGASVTVNSSGGGDGGDGASNTYKDGTTDYYAGGGGGATNIGSQGLGGQGGGGNGNTGTSGAGFDGTANTGGGGGGGTGGSVFGGNGGSGIYVIRYKTDQVSA